LQGFEASQWLFVFSEEAGGAYRRKHAGSDAQFFAMLAVVHMFVAMVV